MKKRKSNNTKLELIVGVIVVIAIAIFGWSTDSNLSQNLENSTNEDALQTTTTQTTTQNLNGNLVVDFIDVGQGDSILIRQGDYSMVIDGGTSESKDTIINFLNSENITYLNYIVGTHPHEDHIGSLDDIVSSYDFGEIIFPKVTTTTKTFENLVKAVQAKGKTFTTPVVGKTYSLGDATFVIYAPNSEKYNSLNNYSVVIKMTYGNTSFLFTGDAENLSETEMLNAGYDLKADVLKVGHHGSTTSTSVSFLDAVSPKYAVISVGKDNSYNHPTKTTMDKLKERNIPVYRTDESGTIECTSDGTNITFNVEPGSYDYMGN